MSSSSFPVFPGLDVNIVREPNWDGSNIVTAVSGKETSIAYWSSPRYTWTLTENLLRSGTRYGVTYTELQQLIGFFNSMGGQFDSFLFTDPDDNSATGSLLGTANGTTVDFQLVRTFGNFIEPVLAPNVVSAVKVNGVTQNPANYTVNTWGSAKPGVITFNVAPTNGAGAITADFSFYWPCRFFDKTISLSRFLYQMYESKGIKIISKK